MKRSLFITTGLLAASVAGIVGTSMVSAATSGRSEKHAAMEKKLAEKFGLNQDEVKKFFEEQHLANQAEREAEIKTRLDQAVKDGKITQAQEDALIAKQKEMHDFMATLKDKTEDERHAAMKTKMQEMKTWATDNNIPTELMHGRGMGGHGKGMMGRGHHMEDEDNQTNYSPDTDSETN